MGFTLPAEGHVVEIVDQLELKVVVNCDEREVDREGGDGDVLGGVAGDVLV